jgi:hypothetical protein
MCGEKKGKGLEGLVVKLRYMRESKTPTLGLTVPSDIRREYGFKLGDLFKIEVKDSSIIYKLIKEDDKS